MTIRERARVAFERADRNLRHLGDDFICGKCARARADLGERRDFAAHILRITSPDMRERISEAVRNASVTRPSGAEDWDDIVADATDAIMGLLTEEPCDSTSRTENPARR